MVRGTGRDLDPSGHDVLLELGDILDSTPDTAEDTEALPTAEGSEIRIVSDERHVPDEERTREELDRMLRSYLLDLVPMPIR